MEKLLNCRKKINLTLRKKLELLEKYERGATRKELCEEYGIGRSTVSDIIKVKDKLYEYVDCKCTEKMVDTEKTIKGAGSDTLFTYLYKWFTLKTKSGTDVTEAMLREKAIQINKSLGGPADFLCTNTWISKFKRKYLYHSLEDEKIEPPQPKIKKEMKNIKQEEDDQKKPEKKPKKNENESNKASEAFTTIFNMIISEDGCSKNDLQALYGLREKVLGTFTNK